MLINDVIAKSHEMAMPALGDLIPLNTAKNPFVQEYVQNYETIDGILSYKYGKYWKTLAEIDNLWYEQCLSWVYAHLYKYNKLWAVLGLEYDPIANVDADEKETVTNNGGFTLDKEEGARTDTWSETRGKEHSTSTDTGKTYPMDQGGTNFYDSDRRVVDSTSDMVQNGGNTGKSGGKDKDIQIHNDVTVIERKRKGNIGITATQQLIAMEKDTANFVFWEEFFRDLVGDLCYNYNLHVGTEWGW